MNITTRNKRISVLLLLTLISMSCATKKPVQTPQTPIDAKRAAFERVVDSAARLSSILSASIDVVVALRKDGSITREQEVSFALALRKVNTPTGVLIKQLKNYNTLDDIAKTDLANYVKPIADALQELNNAKLFGIKNETAIERANSIIATLSNLVTFLKSDLGG